MEYVWILSICAGISGWGCGSIHRTAMPSFEICSQEARNFELETNGVVSTDEDSQAAYATCQIVDVINAPPHPSSWNIKD